MDNIEQQIQQVQADIARYEIQAVKLEAEIGELERELEEFSQRYNRIVQPITNRLQAVKDAIAEMEKRRRLPDVDEPPPYKFPSGYVPVEEQFRRAWEKHTEPGEFSRRPKPKPGDDPEAKLKQLYRQLARRYHPDFARDEADREHRTTLMTMINDAYANHDLDALKALAEAAAVQPQAAASVPLGILRLRQMQQTCGDLARRVADLEHHHSTLLHTNLMDLKIEETLVKLRGRDLLREMAARLEGEYQQCMARLDALRLGR